MQPVVKDVAGDSSSPRVTQDAVGSLAALEARLKQAPKDPDLYCRYGESLQQLGRLSDALGAFDLVLRLDASRPDVQTKRAHVLYHLNRHQESLAAINKALSISPQDLFAVNTRGMILESIGRYHEALADFDRVLEAQPENSGAISNRGMVLARFGRFDEALSCYERVLALAPGDIAALYNRCMARLSTGDWRRGFQDFEIRWKIAPPEAQRWSSLGRRWSGQDSLAGKTILLHHEQGYGDAIQFMRYAIPLRQRGASVIVAVPKALYAITRTLPGPIQVIAEGAPVPPHDFYCPMMSLPLAFGTTPDSVPAPVPYLFADKARAEAFGAQLGPARRGRIGLVWSGRCYPPINYPRDIAVHLLGPLLTLDAEFVSLQTEVSEADRPALAGFSQIRQFSSDLRDFADTAALIANVDLVIAVDTAVAHLAGAMGKPVWSLHRHAACWRWLQRRSDSPWYPTMRLFRQPRAGDWISVVSEVQQALVTFIGNWQRTRPPRAAPPILVEVPPEADIGVQLNAALQLHRDGQIDQAMAAYRAVLKQLPTQADALQGLGIALAQGHQFDQAVACLKSAIHSRPNDATLYLNLGNALSGGRRHDEALDSFRQAVHLDPLRAESYFGCGVSHLSLQQFERAVRSFDEAIALRRDYPEAYNNRGNAYTELRDDARALVDYEAALALRADFVDALVNRANALRRLRRLEEAVQTCEQALQVLPTHCEAHNARGAALVGLGRYRQASDSYALAMQSNPAFAEARWNKSLIHLLEGDFERGWPLFESRWDVRSLGLKQPYPPAKAWHGHEPLHGRTILLYAEQGYGDTVQFCRYVGIVKALGARVLLKVPKALAGCLVSLKGVDQLLTADPTEAFDYHCSLMSLPGCLGTDESCVPADIPYLRVDPSLHERWAERLGPTKSRRVGLAWAGRATHRNDANRSIRLQELLPILDKRFDWISVQPEIRTIDAPVLARLPQIRRFETALKDFAETAALVSQLDLVVCVDTAVAHVAGALGKPVWILLPFDPDWRWQLHRSDSVWYPSARLFRQSKLYSWDTVVEQLSKELAVFRPPAAGM